MEGRIEGAILRRKGGHVYQMLGVNFNRSERVQRTSGVSPPAAHALHAKHCSQCFAKYEAIQFSTLTPKAFDYYYVHFEDGELRGPCTHPLALFLGNAALSDRARTKLWGGGENKALNFSSVTPESRFLLQLVLSSIQPLSCWWY